MISITSADLAALSPLLVIGAGATVLLLVLSWRRSHTGIAAGSMAVLALAIGSVPTALREAPRQVTPLLTIDAYALLYTTLLLAATFAVAVLAHGYLENRPRLQREEFYIVLLLAALGATVLTASSHFASFFLGLETLSVSLYTLIAYPRTSRRPLQEGVKYLVLAGASSAILLFGMALLYGETGTMDLAALAPGPAVARGGSSLILVAGTALMIAGIGFKLAVVPFHMWTPDVYAGAPAPVTALLATVSKGAMFAFMLRAFSGTDLRGQPALFAAFAIIAAASMVVGNLLALLAENVKRILAYSSIAHLGYLLVAFLAGGDMAAQAVTFYLAAYMATTLVAFGVVTVLSGSDEEAERLDDYRGLFWRRPWIAAAMTVALLSLAGIPLTAGFLGKFYVLAAGVDATLWLLVFFLVANSALGLYYYLRIVVVMLDQHAVTTLGPSRAAWPAGIALTALTLLLVWLGAFPTALLRLIQLSVAGSF